MGKIIIEEPNTEENCNRLDDKISRIKKSNKLRKNDVADIFGYVALLLIQNGWTEFEDQKD